MLEVNDIRKNLANYLAKKISLSEFEDWFVQNSWDSQKAGNLELRELVHTIELRLSEFSSGHLTEQGLYKELLPFVTSISTSVLFGNVPINTPMGMDIKWLEVGRILFADPAHRESSVVFV